MTDQEPKQEHFSEQQTVQVRRAPRYGVFMGLGAVGFALAGGIYASMVEPGVRVDGTPIDTTPVIGFTIVAGFVLGAALGAVLAIILDFFVGRKTRAAEVERTAVTTHYPESPAVDDGVAESGATDETASPPNPEKKS